MISNLGNVVSILFKRVSVQEIIVGNSSSGAISCMDFIQLMRAYSDTYSETELRNLYNYLTGMLVEQFYGAEQSIYGRNKLDVFFLLRCCSERLLIEQDNEITCVYSEFLNWRMITSELDEDLFVASYLASKERNRMAKWPRFDWKTTLTHNNRKLHKVLGQGMAENHSHLKGASAVFQMTWIRLMNNLSLISHSGAIREIDKNRRNLNIKYNLSYQEKSWKIQLLQAVCIRFLLFEIALTDLQEKRCLSWQGERSVLHKKCISGSEYMRRKREQIKEYLIWLKNPDSFIDIRENLASDIYALQNPSEMGWIPDYALTGFEQECEGQGDRVRVLEGERWLLYRFFIGIYGKTGLDEYRDLFYAYLVIKENFRSEIVQNNRSVGFENFSVYERRKDIFLNEIFFNRELVRKAIEAALIESHAIVTEARIATKNSAREYYEYINKVDHNVGRKYQNRFFYTVHFIKEADNRIISDIVECRHEKKRRDYKRQAVALVKFRENYPGCADRVRGIDAANMEIGCGPEVFGQVFRYLSNHRLVSEIKPGIKVPQLRKTYHVGEDFLDLVSGLRAIDETIHFLGISCGDRMGHALALGVNVEEWYHGKKYRILLTQQEHLDNIAWMYHFCVTRHLNVKDTMLNFLRKEYDYYFQLIFKNAINQKILEHINCKAMKHYKDTEWEKYYYDRIYDFSIENYCSAWELRGDNPDLYREGYFNNESIVENEFKSFSYYAMNREFPKMQNKRYFQEIAVLYYYYHFDPDVRREGDKSIEKRIDREYLQCVQLLQKELQKVVVEKGIAIETNPSSNFLIGTFKRYDEHPILNFYNRELTNDLEKLEACPQMNVSINTDDAGIFNTSLENEYAYMALALEKATDENGDRLYKKENIYSWLDHIRVMGLQQTFLSDEEMRQATWAWNHQIDANK